MTDFYNEIEACIQAILASVLSDQKSNIAKLMRDYAVSASQLQACYNE
jgi:hypothetical protein